MGEVGLGGLHIEQLHVYLFTILGFDFRSDLILQRSSLSSSTFGRARLRALYGATRHGVSIQPPLLLLKFLKNTLQTCTLI